MGVGEDVGVGEGVTVGQGVLVPVGVQVGGSSRAEGGVREATAVAVGDTGAAIATPPCAVGAGMGSNSGRDQITLR